MKTKLIIIIAIIIAIVGIIIYTSIKEDDIFMENIVESASEELKKDINSCLLPVKKQLYKLVSFENPLPHHPDSLSIHLIKKLGSTKEISTLMIYRGNILYLVYRNQNTWVSTSSEGLDSNNIVIWKRWDNKGELKSEWSEVLDTNRILINWIKDQYHNKPSTGFVWSGVYLSDFIEEAVIAIASNWKNENNSDSLMIFIEIPVKALRQSTGVTRKYKDLRMFMIAGDSMVIPIPGEKDSLNSFTGQIANPAGIIEQDSILKRVIVSWETLGRKLNSPFIFNDQKKIWWNYVSKVEEMENIKGIGISTTEESLKFGALRQYYLLAIIFGLLLLGLLISIIISYRKRRAATPPLFTDQDMSISTLVKSGESNNLEFKSSIRWDYRLEKVNPILEDVVVKTVAAFNNGEGGKLIIGVDDDGNILGLKNDFNSLKKHDEDYFELHLRNLLNKNFSITYITGNIKVSFESIEGNIICLVDINKGNEPLFIISKDKNGNRKEKFYIRSGNSSQEITSLKEISDYINKRF